VPLVEVSVGELLDKWSILEIKAERLTKPSQQENILSEMGKLVEICEQYLKEPAIDNLYKELLSVNLSIWMGMDELYAIQNSNDAGLIELTNRITHLNQDRAYLKKEIDQELQSEFSEEKSYF
jgi:hypothetical protein